MGGFLTESAPKAPPRVACPIQAAHLPAALPPRTPPSFPMSVWSSHMGSSLPATSRLFCRTPFVWTAGMCWRTEGWARGVGRGAVGRVGKPRKPRVPPWVLPLDYSARAEQRPYLSTRDGRKYCIAAPPVGSIPLLHHNTAAQARGGGGGGRILPFAPLSFPSGCSTF